MFVSVRRDESSSVDLPLVHNVVMIVIISQRWFRHMLHVRSPRNESVVGTKKLGRGCHWA